MREKMRRSVIITAVLMGLMLVGVSAMDAEGAYAKAKADPGKVSSMSLTVTGQPLAKIGWQKATGKANGYTIVRNGKAIVRINGKDVLSYVDESLEPGESYSYRVVPHYKNSKGKLTYGKASPVKKVRDGYTYVKEDDGTLTLTGFTGRDKTVKTPEKIGKAKVTRIGDSCFRGNVWVKKVIVSDGVTAVEDYAFEACSLVKSVTLPESVETIGDGAFSGCAKMQVCEMPDGVTEIGAGAFLYCSRLAFVNIPESLKTMGDFAFAGCERVIDVDFNGTDLKAIPDRAFYKCVKMEEIVIPAGVETIGKRAFSGCESLQKVTIGGQEHVAIGPYAFEHCGSLQIGATESQTPVSLDYAAFSSLYRGILNGQPAELYLPNNVELGEGVFFGSNITGLINDGIMRQEEFSNYTMKEGVLYSKDMQTMIAYFPKEFRYYCFEETEAAATGEFTVPEGVETIAPYAFYGSNLKKVNLPASLKRIEHNAFTLSCVTQEMLSGGEGAVIDEAAFENNGYQEEDPYVFPDEGYIDDEDSYVFPDFPYEDESEGPLPIETISFEYASMADGGIFDTEAFQGYLDIHEGFSDWCQKYAEYNEDNVPVTADAMPYITMYTGEDHYRQMASALNGDTYKTQESIERSGDDYLEMYLMMDHGLFAELSRGRMPGDLLLYSGITPERVSGIAGQEEKAQGAITDELRSKIIGRIGEEFSDPAIMSTTASVGTAFSFSSGEYGSNTIIMIYGSKGALDQLGTICVDLFSQFSGEEEVLFNARAHYRILDVGTAKETITLLHPETGAVMSTEEGEQRTYVKVQLLGDPEGAPEETAPARNNMKAKAKTVKVKASALEKKNVKVAAKKAVSVKGAKGTVTYKKKSGSKKIRVNSKTGKITIRKGLPRGTYKVKLQVTDSGGYDHLEVTKPVTVRIKVR